MDATWDVISSRVARSKGAQNTHDRVNVLIQLCSAVPHFQSQMALFYCEKSKTTNVKTSKIVTS